MLFRTEILPDKGGYCRSEGGDGEENKALNLGISAAARHCIGAEGVDIALHDHIGYRNDRILYAGGDALTGDLAEHGKVKSYAFQHHALRAGRAEQLYKAHGRADGLAQNGGYRRARNAHVERSDKYEVKDYVHARGEYQVVKRRSAVAHSLQYAHAGVVHKRKEGADKIQAEICNGEGQHVLRCVHNDEHLRCKKYPHYRHKDAAHRTEGYVRVNGSLHGFEIFCPEIAADDDARAQ